MIFKQRQRVRLFSLIATFLMMFSLMTPAFVAAEESGSLHRSVQDSKLNAMDKVSDRLLNEFKDQEKVTFLVKFADKAEVKKVAEEAKNKASLSNLSGQESVFLQRSTVVSELKATSFESQKNVVAYLEEEMKKGTIEDYYSYFIVNGIAITATQKIAEEIATFDEVEKILPNEIRQLNETKVEKEQAPKSKLANVEWNVERVGAPEAWEKGVDGTGTVVASIDSGVQWDHPALKEKYRGYDSETGEVNHDFNWYDPVFYEDEPYDDIDHGTHVTGTMVGSEPDGSNHIGVAPGAKWISVKAFSHAGGFDDDLLRAAEWILAPTDEDGNERIDMAPDVVNNSWGGGQGLDEWYRDVVIAWRSAEIFPEFSAGNTDLFNPGGPGSIAVPANYPESFATGATDDDDIIAEFSLRGPSPYDEIKPEVSAPGENIRSAVPGDGYESGWNGTSMAGPAVSAVAAMLRQLDSTISVSDMEDIIMNTAIPKTDDEYPDVPNNGYGHGIVNAESAVTAFIEDFGQIEGTVTQIGEDHEPPIYHHEPVSEVFSNMNLDLHIAAEDNISVTSVELSYQIDESETKVINGEIVSGDHTSGEYVATIPSDELEGNQLSYKWIINDFSGNETRSDQYHADIHTGVTIGYQEDFQEEPDGWYSFGRNDSWEWGEPKSGPKKADVGDHVYATNLSGDYDDSMDSTLVMPQITLPENENVYLQFAQWHSFISPIYPGQSGDYGHIIVSTDQDRDEWTRLKTVTDKTDGWEISEIDLSQFAGESIFIGFQATSDYYLESDGWYIDDVRLSDTSLETHSKTALNKTLKEDKKKNNGLLPMKAHVSVLETGRSVYSDISNGEYSLYHELGTYTLQAESYGFYSEQKQVTVESDRISEENFTLTEIEQGTINGTVTDENSGEPIADARVLLVEDANVEPVTTDEDGNFSMTAYEGTYTLKVMARDYHGAEVEVTVEEGTVDVNVELEPYYTYPGGEIGYDDGTPDNARAFYDAGNGWAVKMSLPEGKDSAIVTDGVFKFWDPEFPVPGGTGFQVEVWDASGSDGMPGEKLAGPVDAEAIRDKDEWTVVDLSEHNIIVEDDFYMVYIQTEISDLAPGLATDETSPNANRSYQLVGNSWEQSPAEEGNYMIRSRVAYEVEDPVITSPTEDFITSDEEVTVEGTASPTTTVELMNNGKEVDSAEVGDDGEFTFSTTLTEGENELTAVSLQKGSEVGESETVSITLDTMAPELTIDNPTDGEKSNRETVTVEGTVDDETLDYVEVNGQQADIDGNDYSKRILLDNGENVIEVTAVDLAGNETTESVTIDVKYDAPEINNLTPTEDHYLETGQSVKIEFDSEPGLRATFVVHMPLTDMGDGTALASNPTELPMMEMPNGKYVGYWTVPSNAYADGARIEVKVEDSFGNEARDVADGELYINLEE